MASFSQFLLDSNEQRRLDIQLRNKWMIRLRWLYVILIPAVGITAVFIAHDKFYYIRVYAMLMVVGLLANGLLWATATYNAGSRRYFQTIALLQILLDLILASAVIYAGEGADSRAIILYAMPIVMSGILFPPPGALVVAGLSGLSYIAVIVLYPLTHHITSNLRLILAPGIFYPLFFLLLAAIMTRFSVLNAMDERERTYRELLSMLRHQLHNPSSVMAAIIEMLEFSDTYKDWSAQDKSYLRQLKHENLRLNNMITNILESVSENVETAQEVDLLQLVNEAAISCATGYKRLSDLKTNLPNASVKFTGQALQLRTAFDNILENAFRYSKKGNQVAVSLMQDTKANTASIKIADKGPGMSKSDQSELFKLFTRLEEHHGTSGKESQKLYATGLGLYVSKVIIERHHGELDLASELGKGTTITIKL